MPAYDFRAVSALLIDDNSYMRRVARVILRGLGIVQIDEAEHGGTALDRLDLNPPDLIFCDLSMAPMDGLQFVRRLRACGDPRYSMTPVVMMTAHTDKVSICAARDAGATEFLAKPISPQAVIDRVVQVIERPRPFIRAADFLGPDRRRRRNAPPGSPRRRRHDAAGDTVEI